MSVQAHGRARSGEGDERKQLIALNALPSPAIADLFKLTLEEVEKNSSRH